MLYRTSSNIPVFGLRREIDRLFEDTFGGNAGSNWTPAVDIKENQNELTFDVELPGINPENVEITADNGVLTIRGEKHSERKEDDEDSRYHVIERSYGSFVRSFQLPQNIDESKIEATCNNGILSVHIPKAALPQPKKIQIKSGEVGSGQRQMAGASTGSQSGQRRVTTGESEGRTQQPMAASGSTSGSKNSSGKAKPEARS